ncbi:hypothetical protein Q5P01_002905 [Channa striata]|uniref:Serine protease n=1 Tax=Channa striata TaxID=64152 RepID=A0AA88T571_CHASR|nr:hypothetical protein Q5P01_002905 [Channa striata]
MTVEEALKRDGRFIDDLGDFTLTDNDNPNVFTHCKQRVDNLDHKAFKIRLNKIENYEKENKNLCASYKPQRKLDIKVISEAAQQRGVSVKTVMEKRGSDNTDEIYKLLREQCPGLKEWMENRFPGNSYQNEMKLRKENFGKIQQSFSEVHRVRKLLQLSRSVCKLIVKDVCEGTGFVLFENFILTNAHLFKDCVEGEKLQEDIDVFALFNYDEPEPDTNFTSFSAEKTFVDFDMELDYALLKLNPQGEKMTPKTKAPKIPVPPGLLKKFGPMPPNGEACLIGHPKGEVKKMDPTCIIEKEKREQTVFCLMVYQSECGTNFWLQQETDPDDRQTKGVKRGILTVLEDGAPALLSAWNVEYPKELNDTFEAIQHIFMELSTTCSQRVRSLKTKLLL